MQKIYLKMIEALQEFDAIEKSQKCTINSSGGGYRFRGIDQFLNEAHRVFSKIGIFLLPEVTESSVQVFEVAKSGGGIRVDKVVSLKVKFTFCADDGSHVSSICAGEGIDSGDKATNKAMSAALKYCLAQTFLIPTEDTVDADNETPSQPSQSSIGYIQVGKFKGKKFTDIARQDLIDYCTVTNKSESLSIPMKNFIDDARDFLKGEKK